MAHEDAKVKEVETALVKLAEMHDELSILRTRFNQVERRAPFLKELAQAGRDGTDRLLAIITADFDRFATEREKLRKSNSKGGI